MLKILFFSKLECLKFLKDIFEEDSPIVAPEISHNFIFPFCPETFLCLAYMVEGTPKFCDIITFYYIYLS